MASISTQLLILGAGVTGLGIAWDACLRGIKVIVIEQDDIGEGTTGRFHGLLHSGGRYAISDPQSAKECSTENEVLKNIVPGAIEDTGGLFVSTPADPIDFPDLWSDACKKLSIPFEELTTDQSLSLEPNLNPRISQAFHVRDAAIDSFNLTHLLLNAILESGGVVLLHHRLESFSLGSSSIIASLVRNSITGADLLIGSEYVINATGPWVNETAEKAGLQIPLALGKGSMVAMSQRLSNSVLNRCRPASDGDIIVPIGTVSVVGSTDNPVESPRDRTIDSSEIDLLLAEGDVLIPGFTQSRALRAWSGIRALYQPDASEIPTRSMPRTHAIIDHARSDGLMGMISVFGGKLTTFRLIAEETVDLICSRLGIEAKCSTKTTPIPESQKRYYRLPDRAWKVDEDQHAQPLLCECELIRTEDLANSLAANPGIRLDDLRRRYRLGMGPCQSAFCGVRAANLLSILHDDKAAGSELGKFILERWKGNRPLAWGAMLRQMEFQRRIYLDLFGHNPIEEGK